MMKEYARLAYCLIFILGLKTFGSWALLTESAQNLCSSLYQHVSFPDYHQALICGTSLPQDSFQSQLLQIGLIHMLVVSGAHLGFLQNIFQLLKLPRILIWGLLSAYTLFSGAQAPVLRAWAQRSNKMPSSMQQVVWAGVFCIGIYGFSFSLLLSWLATLGVMWPGRRSLLKQALLIYSVMTPALFSLGTQHPLSIVWNLIVASLLGWGLLPISLLAPIHPWIGYLSEGTWKLFLGLTQWMAWMTPHWDWQFKISVAWPWIYLFVLQWIALKKEQTYYQQQL